MESLTSIGSSNIPKFTKRTITSVQSDPNHRKNLLFKNIGYARDNHIMLKMDVRTIWIIELLRFLHYLVIIKIEIDRSILACLN